MIIQIWVGDGCNVTKIRVKIFTVPCRCQASGKSLLFLERSGKEIFPEMELFYLKWKPLGLLRAGLRSAWTSPPPQGIGRSQSQGQWRAHTLHLSVWAVACARCRGWVVPHHHQLFTADPRNPEIYFLVFQKNMLEYSFSSITLFINHVLVSIGSHCLLSITIIFSYYLNYFKV